MKINKMPHHFCAQPCLCFSKPSFRRKMVYDTPSCTLAHKDRHVVMTQMSVPISDILGWAHACNVTAYRNTVSWQCGRDSRPRNVSKVGYAVTLRACSVCCRYLAVASKGWYGYGLSRCWTCNVTLHVHTWSGRNRIIPLMRRPNTDSTSNKPVTLPRNQLLIRYAGASLVQTVTIRCYDKR